MAAVKDRYDVIVAGSGPAGFSAAYYAARNGADVLLVERNPTLGGMLTTGLMGVFCGRASSGLWKEICATIGQEHGSGPGRQVLYDVELMRQFLFEKVEESGMSLLVSAPAVGVRREGDSIASLQVFAKQGPIDLTADVYIDATGDGDVAAAAGEEFCLGRESDGKFQPMTLIFHLAGVDRAGWAAAKDRSARQPLREKLMKYVERGDVAYPAGHVIFIRGIREGTVKINMTNVIDLDGTKSEDLTAAEILCRKQLAGLVEFLRKEAPGFENCYVACSADMMGVRSTRHFRGKHVLNEKEISEGTVFPDWIASRAWYVWGTHNLYGPIGADNRAKSKYSPYGQLPHDKEYTIPLGALTPAGTDNLLLAGRCISGTFLAHSNYRVMPICMSMGQGAGTAAALATGAGKRLAELDVTKVQETLVAQGMDRPETT